MKLATLKDGSRDGLLAVVSRDMTMAHHATGIATTLQQVLDDWNFRSPPLEDLYATLNGGKARHAFAFKPQHCMAPLPRAHQWADGSAYLNHVELVRKARGAEVPQELLRRPADVPGRQRRLPRRHRRGALCQRRLGHRLRIGSGGGHR